MPEVKSAIKSELQSEIKSEIKTEECPNSMSFSLSKVKSEPIKSEAKLEHPALLPVKTETSDQKSALGNVVDVNKNEGKRSFTPDSKPTSSKRMKRNAGTEECDIILTTYSLIWRDLSELQKKHFGIYCCFCLLSQKTFLFQISWKLCIHYLKITV